MRITVATHEHLDVCGPIEIISSAAVVWMDDLQHEIDEMNDPFSALDEHPIQFRYDIDMPLVRGDRLCSSAPRFAA